MGKGKITNDEKRKVKKCHPGNGRYSAPLSGIQKEFKNLSGSRFWERGYASRPG
jgi:hypothetical protein